MKTISVEELHQQLNDPETASIMVDVRERFEHQGSHIPGAENIPLDTVAEEAKRLQEHGTVYVSCNTGGRSSQACEVLQKHGVNVVNVEGGFSAWAKAGFEVVGGRKVIPLIRQVMITAGLLIILGVILALQVHQDWIYLSAFVGAGLLFAGVTGYCGMTKVLKYMPWNR